MKLWQRGNLLASHLIRVEPSDAPIPQEVAYQLAWLAAASRAARNLELLRGANIGSFPLVHYIDQLDYRLSFRAGEKFAG